MGLYSDFTGFESTIRWLILYWQSEQLHTPRIFGDIFLCRTQGLLLNLVPPDSCLRYVTWTRDGLMSRLNSSEVGKQAHLWIHHRIPRCVLWHYGKRRPFMPISIQIFYHWVKQHKYDWRLNLSQQSSLFLEDRWALRNYRVLQLGHEKKGWSHCAALPSKPD